MIPPELYLADSLGYETSIAFPRIIIGRERYQDLSWDVYIVQHFFNGSFYENRFPNEETAVKAYQEILQKINKIIKKEKIC